MDCNDVDGIDDSNEVGNGGDGDETNGDNEGMDYNNDHEVDIPRISYQNQALPLLSHARRSVSQQQQKNFEDHQHQQMSTTGSANILSSRLSPDINALNISSSNLNQQNNQQYLRLQQQQQQQHQHGDHMEQGHHQHQHHNHHQQHNPSHHHHEHQQQTQSHLQSHHQQGKRDILLKIRHQIFERKRLREKGYEAHVINASTTQMSHISALKVGHIYFKSVFVKLKTDLNSKLSVMDSPAP
ncbi:polyadenylate-binding protein 1-B-like isoform X1 [Stomoxys calcitrans]|uniref:polyadenylate-binding protein 1-B-like isoform X1 n=1 Tax=Stomoxys calcitrans TaxID=35570 RepID=UPI0027E3882C|nr:polyadenylate-binding protein 1-B-like isoform X1 [Stomoxys calcitrans]